MSKWWDKKLPAPLDETETYRSAAEAVGAGAVAPHISKIAFDRIFGKPKTLDGKMGRTVLIKLAASLLAEAALRGKKALHDDDPRSGNIHIANMASLPFEVGKDVWDQYQENKKLEQLLKRPPKKSL